MNDIEWVAESDWTSVKVGQRVKLTNGDGEVEFQVRRLNSMPYGDRLYSSSSPYCSLDWSLFVEVPPAVVLPTEPGFYIDTYGALWTLGTDSNWRNSYDICTSSERAWQCVPYTRLEPVPETAKKVLDRVSDGWKRRDGTIGEYLTEIAAEFGVDVDK